MTSIFQRALGESFSRLHPELRRRFGVGVRGGEACVGTGSMDEIWHGPFSKPFLRLGARRNILVPGSGAAVPFVIENYPYTDSFGRETVSFVRTFSLPGRARRFDATMIYSPERGCVVDYLGTHQHLAVDLHPSVDDSGALIIRSGDHRFYEGFLGFRLPAFSTGVASVRESFDEDLGRFRISVDVTSRLFGPLFGYRGTFSASYVDLTAHPVPDTVKPLREEVRT